MTMLAKKWLRLKFADSFVVVVKKTKQHKKLKRWITFLTSGNMVRRKWILVVTVFVTIAQQIEATCVCNEKGTDNCACGGTVSPKPKHVKRPEFKLPPLGDNCWCSKTMIEPASLPKPCSKHKKTPASCDCQGVVLPPSYIVPQPNYPYASDKDNTPPADPISISLAAQAGKATQVPEATLAYGFVRKPVNNLPKVCFSSIKEENLYALANDIITLKKPTGRKTERIEYDYPEPDDEEPDNEAQQPFSLTYKQLGYGPDDFQNPTFIPISRTTKAPAYGVKSYDASDYDLKPGASTEMKQRREYGTINCYHY